MDEDFAAAHRAAAPDAGAPPDESVRGHEPVPRRLLRRDTIVLTCLLAATLAVFGGIAWDAGWIGPGDGIPASHSTGPAVGPNTGAGAPSSAGTAPGTSLATPSTGTGGGAASGQGGRNSSGSGSAFSSGGGTQGDAARRAATRPAPRPPTTPGISQDELGRRRNAVEATVPVATASMAPPGNPATP